MYKRQGIVVGGLVLALTVMGVNLTALTVIIGGLSVGLGFGLQELINNFVSKLTDADAEQLETQHWLEVAHDCGYLDAQQAKALLAQTEEVGRLIGSMIAHAPSFCAPKPLREPDPIYDFQSEADDNASFPTDLLTY